MMPVNISIHAPLTGSDVCGALDGKHFKVFQSTLPLRGATALTVDDWPRVLFQSTLPLRGAT